MGRGLQMNTPQCRARVEDEMQKDPVLARRLDSREKRHGLLPSEEAGADDQETAEVQKASRPRSGYAPTSQAALPAASHNQEGGASREGETSSHEESEEEGKSR